MELEPMYMLRPIHIVFAALLFTSLPCSAQPFFVIGAGMKSCGNWTEAVQNPSVRAQYGSWVLGFLSGSNLQSSSVQGTVTDAEAAVAFIDEYCKHNPLHQIVWGAAALVQESGGPKAQHQWKR